MPSNRDEAVGGYIRHRLKELEATRERGWQLDFARTAGFVPSVVAQVKRGLGVGAKTGPGFAKALGFKSFDDLRSEAYRWWQAERQGGAPSPVAMPDAAREAVGVVLELGEGTREQLHAIVAAYDKPRFAVRDRGWWIQTLLTERRADVDFESHRASRAATSTRQKASEPAPKKRSPPRASSR